MTRRRHKPVAPDYGTDTRAVADLYARSFPSCGPGPEKNVPSEAYNPDSPLFLREPTGRPARSYRTILRSFAMPRRTVKRSDSGGLDILAGMILATLMGAAIVINSL